jgi:hypothetical protein
MITANTFIKEAASAAGVVDDVVKGAKSLYKKDITTGGIKGWFGKTWKDATGKNLRAAESKHGKIINDRGRQVEGYQKGLARADKIQAEHAAKRKKSLAYRLTTGEKSTKAEKIRASVLNAKKTKTTSNASVRAAREAISDAEHTRNMARLKLGTIGATGVGAVGYGAHKLTSGRN